MQDKVIYLDNAATSFPKPDAVHEFMGNFYRRCGVNPGRTGCDMAIEAEEMVLATRTKLSALFNASLWANGDKKDPNRLVFTQNATAGLNMILNGTLGSGDHVVTTHLEHNSVIRPINHLVKAGVNATFVKPGSDGLVDPEEIRSAIRGNTKLVVVNHASNVTGVVQDIAAIGVVCKQSGAQFVVDAAQTAGVVPIDMWESDVDFLVFTGHKGLMGPTGIGGICVSDTAEVTTTVWGGTGVKSAEPYHLQEYPFRLEAGTLNVLGIAGLSAGVDWINAVGINSIHRQEMELIELLLQGLTEIDGVTVYSPCQSGNRVAICSICVSGYDPTEVGMFLDVDHNVITRTGLQCAPLVHDLMGTSPRGTVRFSVGPFNTANDIEVALSGVEAVARERRPGKHN